MNCKYNPLPFELSFEKLLVVTAAPDLGTRALGYRRLLGGSRFLLSEDVFADDVLTAKLLALATT